MTINTIIHHMNEKKTQLYNNLLSIARDINREFISNIKTCELDISKCFFYLQDQKKGASVHDRKRKSSDSGKQQHYYTTMYCKQLSFISNGVLLSRLLLWKSGKYCTISNQVPTTLWFHLFCHSSVKAKMFAN